MFSSYVPTSLPVHTHQAVTQPMPELDLEPVEARSTRALSSSQGASSRAAKAQGGKAGKK